MGEIINLRRVRKAKARAAASVTAAANRALHGRTRVEKAAEALREARQVARLDGARLSKHDDED